MVSSVTTKMTTFLLVLSHWIIVEAFATDVYSYSSMPHATTSVISMEKEPKKNTIFSMAGIQNPITLMACGGVADQLRAGRKA